MTPEGRVKAKIDQLLKEYGAYYHKPVQNGMGKPALDYHVCHRGFYAAIEAKAHGKHMTDRQVETAYEVIAAKGSVFVIDSEDSDDFGALQWWLEQPHPSTAGSDWINESDLYKQRRTK